MRDYNRTKKVSTERNGGIGRGRDDLGKGDKEQEEMRLKPGASEGTEEVGTLSPASHLMAR